MSTPVATVADALISFILSLLRDPAAVEEFDAAPKAVLASKGLQDACAADVQAVKPIIVDNPTVIVKPVPVGPPPPPDPPHSDEVVKEIKHIINQFATIDNRTTIVDQSTNQNIWTEGGDVTQIFDQEAVIASGDGSVAAGDDATVVDSEVDVTIGDVAIGNTTNDGSFNNTGVDPETAEEGVCRRPCSGPRGCRRDRRRRRRNRCRPDARRHGVGPGGRAGRWPKPVAEVASGGPAGGRPHGSGHLRE